MKLLVPFALCRSLFFQSLTDNHFLVKSFLLPNIFNKNLPTHCHLKMHFIDSLQSCCRCHMHTLSLCTHAQPTQMLDEGHSESEISHLWISQCKLMVSECINNMESLLNLYTLCLYFYDLSHI